MLIYHAFCNLFERIGLIIRHSDRDPNEIGVALARDRGLTGLERVGSIGSAVSLEVQKGYFQLFSLWLQF
jgi:hypothetical protein